MLYRKMNMTVFHQNVTNGLKIWINMVISQILVDHFFKPTYPQSRASSKINPVPTKFEKWLCSTKIREVTMLHQKIKMIVLPKCDKWPQILVEHGHFSNFGGIFEKALDCGQMGLKKCSSKIWEMTMFHQILRPFVTFWWNTVIFIFRWSMVAFQIFWWSTVDSQIFVEHGRFSNFGGTLSLLLFLWSMVLSQIFWHQSYHYH